MPGHPVLSSSSVMSKAGARVLGAVCALLFVFGGVASTVVAPSVAAAAQEPWTPGQAPLPTAPLPDGGTAQSMMLNSTSCSSSSFCVAAGWVSDGNDADGYLPKFPFVETYSGGSWTPSVLPLPPDADTDNYALVQSVSCAADGSCAAVGVYSASDASADSDYQTGLLEQLAGGIWTATAAPVPDGPYSGLVNIYSVSCSDAVTCVGVGGYSDFTDNQQYGVIYTLESGTWQMQTIAEPSNYAPGTYLSLTGVSCPDDGDCVAVGSYQFAQDGQAFDGLIITLASGIWNESVAPPPVGLQGEVEELNAVDCPELGSCLAGGFVGDDPVLLQLASGSWSTTVAPEPPDGGSVGEINGVYCPAVGACVATGASWDPGGNEGGMILTQSDGTWSAEDAPLPQPTGSSREHLVGDRVRNTADDSSVSSTLAGVACGADGFCAAAGSVGSGGLVETATLRGLPSVTGVSPAQGPVAGGTTVEVSGTNFGSDSVVSFGGQAAATTVVSSTELEATAPAAAVAESVDITVATGGLASRAIPVDDYFYDTDGVAPRIVSPNSTTCISGTACSFTVDVDGDPTPTLSEVGTLPDGLTFNDNGNGTANLAGTTPSSAAGSYTITIVATSGLWAPAIQIFTINVGPFAVTNTSLPTGVIWTKATKVKYSTQLTAGAGLPPYKWTLVRGSGTLPPGLTLKSTGVISGKATASGTYTFTVEATDAKSGKPPKRQTAEATLTITIS